MMSAPSSESKIIDGRKLARKIETRVKKEVEDLNERGISPCLCSILVGNDPASKLYIKLKHKACERVGITAKDFQLSADVSQEELIDLVKELNKDQSIHGILVQLPLPQNINDKKIMESIDTSKDVDGFHPLNMGNLLIGNEKIVPCTPHGIIHALEEYNVNIQGSNAVIVGHSNVVGKPLASMLLNRNATVNVCHVYTNDLANFTKQADILIVATGVKHLIKAEMVKSGSVIFDVGITEEDGKIYGDVDYENVIDKCSLITPVPGGVGPITVATLLEHVIQSTKISINDT